MQEGVYSTIVNTLITTLSMCSEKANATKALQCRPLVSHNISYKISIA